MMMMPEQMKLRLVSVLEDFLNKYSDSLTNIKPTTDRELLFSLCDGKCLTPEADAIFEDLGVWQATVFPYRLVLQGTKPETSFYLELAERLPFRDPRQWITYIGERAMPKGQLDSGRDYLLG
jgi:hypothetical protein